MHFVAARIASAQSASDDDFTSSYAGLDMNLMRLASSALFSGALAAGLALGAPLAFASEPVHQVRPVEAGFDRIAINGSVDVTFVQGPTPGISIDAPADIASGIHTKVEDGMLKIDSSGLHIIEFRGGGRHSHMMITVTAPNLKEIDINGSSDLYAQSLTSNDDLSVRLRSSGDLHIDKIAVRKLSTAIQGSADVHLAGSAAEQSVSIQGSGDYHAEDLKSSAVSVSIQGSGDAAIWAQDTLAIQIAGSGDVEYWGKPTVSQSIAGSGDVVAHGAKN